MRFFAVLFALLIEQLKPLPRGNPVHDTLTSWMRWSVRDFVAGNDHHALDVWIVTAVVAAVLAGRIYGAIIHFTPFGQLNVLVGLGWDVAVLYVTLGFRQFSHHFTAIRDALERGDEAQARRVLTEWRHLYASELPRSE